MDLVIQVASRGNMKYIKTKIKQSGFYLSSLTTVLVWSVLLIVSVIIGFVFSYALVNQIKELKISSNLESQQVLIVNQVNLNFSSINYKVSEAIAHVVKTNKSELEIINALKVALPSSFRVLISNTPLKNIKPSSFPGINYATLDMLKNAKRANQNPIAEIHLFGQKNQYLNFINILNNEKDSYLVISLPVIDLLKNINNIDVKQGFLEVTQNSGRYSVVKLRQWGIEPKSNNLISSSVDIPNSYFNVNYSYIKPLYLLQSITKLSAIIGVLSSLLLFFAVILSIGKSIKKQKEESKEKPTYVQLEKVGQPKNIAESIVQNEEKSMVQTKIDKNIFRAYDIRGVVDTSLTTGAVKLIGQAIGTENLNRGQNEIIVARDGRLSGEQLLSALIEGLIKSGCNVINIGAVPTGVLYFATHHLGTGSGVMLTGSHNPPNYNGLKIMLDGETLAGKLIMNLYGAIINHELAEGEGSVQEMDIVDDYAEYISSDIQLENDLKVVVDAGNGIGGIVGPQVLEEIGCEVIPLHCEVDGSFPNHHPDPSVPKNLEDLILTVKASNADIGIAFDGDADRLGVVTKEGEMIYPDRLLMLFAQDVLTRQPGSSIIFDVKCTGHLPKEIVKHGGLPIIWKTGHSFIKAKIKETNAALAGEMSGHFFFNERWFGFDDGIYAAARLLEILDNENRPAKEVFDELPNSVSTPELKCETLEGENYVFMDKFQKVASFPDANITTIDGIRADFAEGWGLIRCSNTTPCLVLRFDADNQEVLDNIKEEFRTQILAVDDNLNLPF